eukprot:1141245-Pelagomonas_calceolata.AAC.7
MHFHVKCLHLQVYPNYQDFMNAFAVRGGVVEACPVCVVGSPQVNIFVDPLGHVALLSTHERIFTHPYRCALWGVMPCVCVEGGSQLTEQASGACASFYLLVWLVPFNLKFPTMLCVGSLEYAASGAACALLSGLSGVCPLLSAYPNMQQVV